MKETKREQQRGDNPNRDPLTCEPGAHPVGTGVGAAAGGVAGGAIGAAGGPVGAGIGAAIGAIAGGLGGKAAGEHFNPTSSADLRQYIDYTVVDRDNEKVGTVDAVWEDHTNQPAYVAVRTGWLGIGKAHVVPAQSAEVSESARKIRLPYSVEAIRNAPAFDCQADINTEAEKNVSTYYGKYGYRCEKKETTQARPSQRTAEAGEARMQLKEEAIKVNKREVEAGGVRLRKIVRTETVTQPVELKREEIVVERVPVSEARAAGPTGKFSEEEVYIPLRREEAVITKEERIRESARRKKD